MKHEPFSLKTSFLRIALNGSEVGVQPWSVCSIRDCWTQFWGQLFSTRPRCCRIRFTSVSNVVWPVRYTKRRIELNRAGVSEMFPEPVRSGGLNGSIDPLRNE